MLRRNVHGTYALKVDMSLYSEKYPELGKYVTIQNWRIDYHVSFPYLRAKLKT